MEFKEFYKTILKILTSNYALKTKILDYDKEECEFEIETNNKFNVEYRNTNFRLGYDSDIHHITYFVYFDTEVFSYKNFENIYLLYISFLKDLQYNKNLRKRLLKTYKLHKSLYYKGIEKFNEDSNGYCMNITITDNNLNFYTQLNPTFFEDMT